MDKKLETGIVYEIRCNLTDRVYIGSTMLSMNARIYYHLHIGNTTTSREIILDNNWSHKVLESGIREDDLKKKERYYLEAVTGVIVNRSTSFRSEEEPSWHERNKNYVRKKRQERWIKDKELESEQTQCECGYTITGLRHVKAHKQTKKHARMMEMTPEERTAYLTSPKYLKSQEYARKAYLKKIGKLELDLKI